MSFLNTNVYLGCTGVGIFGNAPDDSTMSVWGDDRTTAWRYTALNIAGWIPGLNILSGAYYILAGCYCDPSLRKGLIARGITHISQAGVLLAPVEIGISLARAVREYLRNRHPHPA